MVSSNSHQNALQGHMVNLSEGAKMQTRLHFQVLRVHACFHRSKGGDRSIHQLSGRGFMCFTLQCKKLHCVSLTKTLVSEMARECRIGAITLKGEGFPS